MEVERDAEHIGKSGLPLGDAELSPDSLGSARQQREGAT